MARPVQPTPCSVTMAARSTVVSWSTHPTMRPNMERAGRGLGGCAAVERGLEWCCSAVARLCSRHSSHVGFRLLRTRPQPPWHSTCTRAQTRTIQQTGHTPRVSSTHSACRAAGHSRANCILTSPAWCERTAACGSACAAGDVAAAAAAARVLGRRGAAEADAPASICSAVWVAGLADGWVLLCSCASLPAAALDPHVAACGRGPSQSSAAGVSDSHRCSVQTGLKYTALAQPLRAPHARAAVCGHREWRSAHRAGQQQWEISPRKTAFLARMHARRMKHSNSNSMLTHKQTSDWSNSHSCSIRRSRERSRRTSPKPKGLLRGGEM
jgi:hypothetical protein